MREWLSLIIDAAGGDPSLFFEDQKNIGYLRAMQGYPFEDVADIYFNFQKEIWSVLEKKVFPEKQTDLDFYQDIRRLQEVCFLGFQTVAASFLQTREEKILEKISQLKFLTGKVLTIQEEERKGLAADIHDSVAQALTGVNYRLQYCLELSKNHDSALNEEIELLLQTVENTIAQTRELMSSLRPELIDSFGLVPALRQHLKTFAEISGITIHFNLPAAVDISTEKSICLFRVAQEALMNIYKHTHEKAATIRLRQTSRDVTLIISDSGPGFCVDRCSMVKSMKNSLGLILMQERIEAVGGRLKVESFQNLGCRITARIPLCRRKHGDSR